MNTGERQHSPSKYIPHDLSYCSVKCGIIKQSNGEVVCFVTAYLVTEKQLIFAFCVELINSDQTRKADLLYVSACKPVGWSAQATAGFTKTLCYKYFKINK